MKYRRRILWPIISLICFGVGCYLLYCVCYTKGGDQLAYLQVVEEAAMTTPEPSRTTRQFRKGVDKDIWFFRGNTRMQLRINSTTSELVFEKEDGKSKIIEKMGDVICWMQEELYYTLPNGTEVVRHTDGTLMVRNGNPDDPSSRVREYDPDLKAMQVVRYIEAEKAVYHYHNDLLEGEKVKLARYIFPGHQLMFTLTGQTPTLTGKAESIEISLLNKELSFKAHKMTATF